MEGNYLTSGDLALFSEAKYGRMGGYEGCGYGYHRRDGMAATGIGLAAGLGGSGFIWRYRYWLWIEPGFKGTRPRCRERSLRQCKGYRHPRPDSSGRTSEPRELAKLSCSVHHSVHRRSYRCGSVLRSWSECGRDSGSTGLERSCQWQWKKRPGLSAACCPLPTRNALPLQYLR